MIFQISNNIKIFGKQKDSCEMFNWHLTMSNRPCFVVRILNLWAVVGLMLPQIDMKANVWFKADVKDYKLIYHTPKYDIKPRYVDNIPSNPSIWSSTWRSKGYGRC